MTVMAGCGEGNQEPATTESGAGPAAADTVLPEDWQPAVVGEASTMADDQGFVWQTEQFADTRILRYQVPGWDKLSLKQKQYVYYLTQAGLAGRDIMWDQNYRHNLAIRTLLERIYQNYNGDRNTRGWQRFVSYLKRIWFSNGMHHHYSMAKFMPEFSREYFAAITAAAGVEVDAGLLEVMFDPQLDAKKVELDPERGLLESSAVNFYAPDVTTAQAQAYYQALANPDDPRPLSRGLNSRLARNADGQVYEQVWKLDGMYHAAIAEIIRWLEQARGVAENEQQAEALGLLVDYYRSGDLKTWDEYNILWTGTTGGDIDYINGFVEVYNDPLGYRGSYEMIVQIKDFESTSRMQVLLDNADWFERNSPFAEAHKRDKVVGITYNVVNVAGEAGDASPSTPVGVNLPNANWIRSTHGSKSVSLGNIEHAYDASSGSVFAQEFACDMRERDWHEHYGEIVGSMHTALHEVIGHASGRLEPGVATPNETLKSFYSTIEEGRADLMALYFMLDPQMVEWGLIPSLDAGRYGYDSYIRNGLMVQLRRLEPGADIEESHMRNRAWISRWVLERGAEDGAIVRIRNDGKTCFDIRDYDRMRELVGVLLREVQRIKSAGDYDAAKNLVENYGVKVDPDLHREVLERSAKLNIAPYAGFINPVLTPVRDAQGETVDIAIEYPDDFATQMLHYSKEYGHLSN